MSRPKPTVVMTFTDPRSYKSEQVLETSAVFAVFHKGKPMNLRSFNSLIDYPGPKYRRAAFGNPGHAFNLAERLNKLFKTDQFAVYKLTEGTRITEGDV